MKAKVTEGQAVKIHQRPTKWLNMVGNVLFIFLLITMLLLNIFLLQSSFSGGVPKISGYQLYIVLSGSMSPTFNTGSMVVVQAQPASEVLVGDVITYRQPGSEKLTTHRVVEISKEEGLSFITRGDANDTVDVEAVPAKNVVGKVVFALPYVGYVISFAKTTMGLIFLFIVPGLLILVLEVRNLIRYVGEWDKQNKITKGRKIEA